MVHNLKDMKVSVCTATIFLLLFGACSKNLKSNLPPPQPSSPSQITYKDTVFTNYFKRTTGWIAGDGAISFPLNNGKSLWTFGDTYIDNYDAATKTVPCLFQVRNAGLSMEIKNPGTQTTYIGNGSPKSWFQVGTDNHYWFWPGPGYAFKDTAYIFLGRIASTGGTGSWAFKSVDSLYAAKIKISTMEVVGYAALGSKNGITFNNSIVQSGDYNYVYGIKNNGFGNDLFVARFPINNLYADWEYFSGSNWTKDIMSAHKIHSEFTSSFDVCKVGDKFILLTTQFSVGCDQGKEIYAYTSTAPFGDFGNKKTVWTVDDTLQGHLPMFYIAAAHPEFDNGKKELLVTYCINGYGTCVNTCVNNRMNPDVYRPKAIRIPYTVLGL